MTIPDLSGIPYKLADILARICRAISAIEDAVGIDDDQPPLEPGRVWQFKKFDVASGGTLALEEADICGVVNVLLTNTAAAATYIRLPAADEGLWLELFVRVPTPAVGGGTLSLYDAPSGGTLLYSFGFGGANPSEFWLRCVVRDDGGTLTWTSVVSAGPF